MWNHPLQPCKRGFVIPDPLCPEVVARSLGYHRIAGVDEAGRGPWAGPVVAAAVILHTPRLSVRIDDSKQLTRVQRERAARVICEHAEVGFGIASAEEIDQRNILQATLLAMRHAVAHLRTPPELILVDGPVSPYVDVPCYPIIRGDQRSLVIGCASILAKVLRDGLMEFYHHLVPHYGFNQHKGYGTAHHAQRLKTFGPSVFHRMSFKPVRDAFSRVLVASIDG